MIDNVIRLPCTQRMVERATSQAERMRDQANWNAKAALEMIQKGKLGAAERFIKYIIATTEG